MNPAKFQEQMARITETFGAKHYTGQRLKIIFATLKGVDDGTLERSVTRLIATRRVPPLVPEFLEAVESVRSEDKQRARENAPMVGMLGQLQEAAKRTTADKDFVGACMSHIRNYLDGKLSKSQFNEGCQMLDQAASELTKRGGQYASKPNNPSVASMGARSINPA